MRYLHFNIPQETYFSWKRYVSKVCEERPELNTTGVFCNLPEITKYLEKPIMVIRKKGKSAHTSASKKPKDKESSYHLFFMVPDEIYVAWYKYVAYRRSIFPDTTSQSAFCSLPELLTGTYRPPKPKSKGRKPIFLKKTNSR